MVCGGQLLLRNLDGCTLCLQVSEGSLSGVQLNRLIECEVGVPAALQRLSAGTRDVSDDTTLVADEQGNFQSCSLLLRLVGGKGGFGSLLRGAATKAGQKKTNNFDACRDMSGRRLRHVNAEKQLREWKAEAKDRDLEKAGEEYLKKLAKEKKSKESAQADLSVLREQSAQAMENVSSAVEVGLQEAKKMLALGKRKVEEDTSPQKRSKLLSTLKEIDYYDDEEDEDEGDMDEETVIKEEDVSGAGPSSASEQSAGKSSDGEATTVSEPPNASGLGLGTSGGSGTTSDDSEQEQRSAGLKKQSLDSLVQEKQRKVDSKTKAATVQVALAGPVKLEDFSSAADLEVLGMEKLKDELQSRGLKCGGSLSERAARLFLLKDTPLEKLNKKHFAKPAQNKKAAG